jgi:hypothetical protein
MVPTPSERRPMRLPRTRLLSALLVRRTPSPLLPEMTLPSSVPGVEVGPPTVLPVAVPVIKTPLAVLPRSSTPSLSVPMRLPATTLPVVLTAKPLISTPSEPLLAMTLRALTVASAAPSSSSSPPTVFVSAPEATRTPSAPLPKPSSLPPTPVPT